MGSVYMVFFLSWTTDNENDGNDNDARFFF